MVKYFGWDIRGCPQLILLHDILKRFDRFVVHRGVYQVVCADVIFAVGMYFKFSGRINPSSGRNEPYLRLVESYRNSDGRVCHRTILHIGFADEPVTLEQLNQISRLLTARYEHKIALFEHEDELVRRWSANLWSRIVNEHRLDLTLFAADNRKIDADTMQHSHVREIGAERMCDDIFKELRLHEVLSANGFSSDQVQLAQTQIISRAVYPASELATSKWILENSAVCELTGYPMADINKDKLYRSALKLYRIKEVLEQHLSIRTNELFDIQDKILLYDLTNTYFEGEKRNSKLAKFGHSKEKRNDAKLVVLAMVVNMYGFVKYSSIHEGNFADTTDISAVLEGLAYQSNQHPAMVVIDAGIATAENLATIRNKGYHYLCVSRSKLKDYKLDAKRLTTIYERRPGKQLILKKIQAGSDDTDYYLEVKSPDKELKEAAMKNQFEERLEAELEKIKSALHKKGGIKAFDKVQRRIGRLAQKYPSAYKYYKIDVRANASGKLATELYWSKDPDKLAEKQDGLGKYILRTDLDLKEEVLVWEVYNTIREIESTFRTLKNDLDLRPIYHKKDASTMAHLHLGILSYWIVNTLRCKLKAQGIHHSWPEIVRIGNTQKVITTTGYNAAGNEIVVRKCSRPEEKLRELYAALKLPPRPFTRRKPQKSVVHKPPLKKIAGPTNSGFT